MTKYKVGEHVRIVSPDSCLKHYSQFIGKTYEVLQVKASRNGHPYELAVPGVYGALTTFWGDNELIKGDPMDNLKQGDVLVNEHSALEKAVQGVMGNLVFTASGDESDADFDTVKDLKAYGWHLKDSTETVEITIEEIAKLKGLKPEQVRIKDKD